MAGRRAWPGCLRLGTGWALYVGPAGDTDLHAHHAIQVAVGQTHSVELGLAEGRMIQGGAVFVPPDVPHCLRGGGQPLALLFLEPESALGRRLLGAPSKAGARVLDEAQVRALREALSGMFPEPGASTEDGIPGLIRALLPHDELPPRHLDARVARVIRGLKETGGIGSLEEAARTQGLSSSRMGHLFSGQVGLPFRPFALWLRLQGALSLLARGANLTEAAHGAGFADSAHLTRTFRRMFGIAPSDLARSTSILPLGPRA